ncbi:MAG TPA: DnaB-like helicase C-terminal domain-containing protein, partial [Kofleriaceae bacterium]
TRYEIASEVSRELKTIAKSEEVLLLCAAQLSRDAGDGSKQPTLDSLRDSGVAEEAADRVIGLWRPQPIEDASATITDGLEIGVCVLKNRFGPTGGETKLQYDHTLRLVQADAGDGIPW